MELSPLVNALVKLAVIVFVLSVGWLFYRLGMDAESGFLGLLGSIWLMMVVLVAAKIGMGVVSDLSEPDVQALIARVEAEMGIDASDETNETDTDQS
ncbi:MAG: hypothetical protein U9N14_04040 [Pseudomonadota bacterium]|nr:hypothetical protein [Pseudomonadota bacterium]